MSDCWSFAFLMTNGDVVHFEIIESVHRAADGTIWIDVGLLTEVATQGKGNRRAAHCCAHKQDAGLDQRRPRYDGVRNG